MSTHAAPSMYPAHTRRLPSTLLYARALWAGLSLITMWLAVLFVGVFGGNIVHVSAGGGSSSVPVVVVVAVAALIGTWLVARVAFKVAPESDELRRLLADAQQARENLAAEVAKLRATLPG